MSEQVTVTIRQTNGPSRSKMAGPCWIRLGDDVYAAEKARTITAEVGSTITATGKVQFRRATKTTTDRDSWSLRVTGVEADKVTLSLGAPSSQAVVVEVTGVQLAS